MKVGKFEVIMGMMALAFISLIIVLFMKLNARNESCVTSQGIMIRSMGGWVCANKDIIR